MEIHIVSYLLWAYRYLQLLTAASIEYVRKFRRTEHIDISNGPLTPSSTAQEEIQVNLFTSRTLSDAVNMHHL